MSSDDARGSDTSLGLIARTQDREPLDAVPGLDDATTTTDDGPMGLVVAQILLTVIAGGALVVIERWSPELHFVLAFVGFLANRVVFAPRERTRWWRYADAVTWLGFVVLAYLLFLKVQRVGGA